MSETVTLTKKEVEKAREERVNGPHDCFFYDYDIKICKWDDSQCRLCKKLTRFASQGEPVGKGGEDE